MNQQEQYLRFIRPQTLLPETIVNTTSSLRSQELALVRACIDNRRVRVQHNE